MSFKRFIYFCALCGGWAAFLAWGLTEVLGLYSGKLPQLLSTALIAGLVGVFVASTIGMLDALLNSVGFQRIMRALVCLGVGLIGGLFGGFVGQLFFGLVPESISPAFRVFGWALVGIFIGASIGVFDLQRAVLKREPLRQATKKIMNGVIGGLVGGVLGGIFFELEKAGFGSLISARIINVDLDTMNSPRAFGLVILGMCIGLMIGTAQVILKEAWVKVEAGFRPGRELMLTKPETTVGRAEGTDIALFGDNGIEKQHAKIVLQGGRYLVVDNGTPGGTFVNGEQISKPTPLRSGDLIQVGKSSLRFGERQKRT